MYLYKTNLRSAFEVAACRSVYDSCMCCLGNGDLGRVNVYVVVEGGGKHSYRESAIYLRSFPSRHAPDIRRDAREPPMLSPIGADHTTNTVPGLLPQQSPSF